MHVNPRGAVLVCALPWFKSLLLQHASGIMSQESSIHALNALYQVIWLERLKEWIVMVKMAEAPFLSFIYYLYPLHMFIPFMSRGSYCFEFSLFFAAY